MQESESVLVIIPNEASYQAVLFSKVTGLYEVVSRKSYPKLLEEQKMVESICYDFEGRYKSHVVVSKSEDVFGEGLRAFAEDGLHFGIEVDGAASRIGYASYGRLHYVQEYPQGLGSGILSLLTRHGVSVIQEWLHQIGYDSRSVNNALNYLANKGYYTQISSNSELFVVAEIMAFRYLLGVIEFNKMRGFLDSQRGWDAGRRVMTVSGTNVHYDSKVLGEVLLAIVDGLQLHGVWSINVDRSSLLTACSVLQSVGSVSAEEMDSIGSIVILDHDVEVGEFLGEVELDVGGVENINLQVVSGQVTRIPLEYGASAKVTLKVKSEVVVSGYEGLQFVTGGSMGFVVDARSNSLRSSALIQYELYRDWKEALHIEV